jgi:hypothetical protein
MGLQEALSCKPPVKKRVDDHSETQREKECHRQPDGDRRRRELDPVELDQFTK